MVPIESIIMLFYTILGRKRRQSRQTIVPKATNFRSRHRHYHPSNFVEPSLVDFDQMIEFSYSEDYDCVAPIMLLAGTGNGINRLYRVFVFPRNNQLVELFLQGDPY